MTARVTQTITVDLAGNRLKYDNSIIAYDDGAFYDHNGSQYYPSLKALADARPELIRYSDRTYTPPEHSGTGNNHNARAVTVLVTEMKSRGILKDKIYKYLPFAVKDRLWGSVGTTNSNQIAVFMFTPSKHGAKRGEHYSFAQYRTDDGWMSITGSDGKAVEANAPKDGPLYCTFGMGDFLLLKSTGLNYLCFGSDGSAKNSPHKQYITDTAAGRTIRLIADNDDSGKKTAAYLKEMGLNVVEYQWNQLQANKPKMDLRDIGWMIKNKGGNMNDFIEYLEKDAYYV